jgi:hypothetical protein
MLYSYITSKPSILVMFTNLAEETPWYPTKSQLDSINSPKKLSFHDHWITIFPAHPPFKTNKRRDIETPSRNVVADWKHDMFEEMAKADTSLSRALESRKGNDPKMEVPRWIIIIWIIAINSLTWNLEMIASFRLVKYYTLPRWMNRNWI